MTPLFLRAVIDVGQSIGLSILVKATLAMVVGLAITSLAAHARASMRHLLLASTFGVLLVLPVALILIPEAVIHIPVERGIEAASSRANEAEPAHRTSGLEPLAIADAKSMQPRWSVLILSGWVVGSSLVLLSLGVSLWRLSRIRRRAFPWSERTTLVHAVAGELGVRRPVDVLLHEELEAPLTCGTRHPVVILPTSAAHWSDADVRRALVHELEHVRRDDWALQLVARIACALYWFHPLVWTLWRQFCLEAERACDDAVLASGEQTDYADQLVQLARQMSNASVSVTLSMASRSDLSARVSAILNGAQKRGRVGILPVTATIAASLVTVLTIAPLRAVGVPRDSGAVRAVTRAEQTTQIPTPGDQPRRNSALDRALFEAARSGDVAHIADLLKAGASANASLPGDGSPLIAAADRGSLDAVLLLLDRGADPNMPIRGDGSPLIAAAREGHLDVAMLLLDRGADVDLIVPGDENPLIQASGSGRIDVARLLVSRGANVNARVWVDRTYRSVNGEWRSPLSMARRGGHEALVQYLLSQGAVE